MGGNLLLRFAAHVECDAFNYEERQDNFLTTPIILKVMQLGWFDSCHVLQRNIFLFQSCKLLLQTEQFQLLFIRILDKAASFTNIVNYQ